MQERRATDRNASTATSFKPGADPDEWIEQLSRPYRERPWAVIRELFQNACDAVGEYAAASKRLIEFALIDSCQRIRPFGPIQFLKMDKFAAILGLRRQLNVGVIAAEDQHTLTEPGQLE